MWASFLYNKNTTLAWSSHGLCDIQLQTNKVIKFDNLRIKFFIKILTSDSEPGTSKTFRKGVALFFPCFFVFSTHPKVSRIGRLWINCVPSVTLMLHVLDRFVKKRIRAQLCLFMGDLTWKGFVHMTISVNFPPFLRDFRWIFGKDFDGIK